MNDMEEMGMELRGGLVMPLCDRVINAEATGDYTLPDYQPEIRRLLGVRPTVLPPAKYVSASGVELSGTVDYQVIYVGADGGLYSLPLSAEYGCTAPLERAGEFDLGEGVTTFATVVSEGINTRVSAPRKLSIRCRMRAHIRAYGRMEDERREMGEVAPSTLRKRRVSCRNLRPVAGVSDLIGVSEEITGISEDARVAMADASAFVREVRAGDGAATAYGDVYLDLTVSREDGRLEVLSRKIPFEGEVEMEGLRSDSSCRVMTCVSELNVHVEEGRVLADVGLLLEGRGMRDETVDLTADLYSTERTCECEWSEYDLPISLCCENGNLSQSERIPLSEVNVPEGANIVDGWGSVLFDTCHQMGEKTVLTGQSRYTFLCEKEGELSSFEVTLPLRYEMAGRGEEGAAFDALGEVISCRARSDGESLLLDAEIAVVADLVGSETAQMVRCARFGECVDREDNRMVVVYPAAGEDAWSVAKRYRVSPEKICEGAGYYYF